MSGRARLAAVALVASAAMLAVACGGAPEPNRVSFRVAPRLSSFVAYLAADAGYFEAEGVEVDLVPFDSPESVIPSLAQGDLDVSTVWRLDPAYINLIARGARLRLVAAGVVNRSGDCGYSAFLARPELVESGRLDGPEGLRGLRVTTERTSTSYYVWSRALAEQGLTLADVTVVDMPTSARPEAFAAGLIDVTTTTEPWRSRMLRAGHARLWRTVADVLPGVQSSFLVFGRRLLEERRDLGVRFLRAYQRAVRDYVEQGTTDRVIEITARHTRIPEADLRDMCWPTYTADGRLDRATFDEYQRWALAQGLIDAVVPFESIFDDGFLRELAAEGAP